MGLATALTVAFVLFHFQGFIDKDIDPYGFGKIGESIASGHWFGGAGLIVQRKAPLYPLVIGGIYALLGTHVNLIFLLHSAYFAATCFLAFDLGRRLFSLRTGVIAGFMCAFNPVLLRYVPSLHLEIQFTFFMTLFVWLTVLFYRRPTLKLGVVIRRRRRRRDLDQDGPAPAPGADDARRRAVVPVDEARPSAAAGAVEADRRGPHRRWD